MPLVRILDLFRRKIHGCQAQSGSPLARSIFGSFSPHLTRALVRAQPEERRMPQATLRRPLDEPYLRHQLRNCWIVTQHERVSAASTGNCLS